MTHKQPYPVRAFISSMSLIATNYAFRCDAKYADSDALEIERKIRSAGCFQVGDYLPNPLVKGIQPDYLDQPMEESVPVINTLSIQNLSLHVEDCRHITREDFESISTERQLQKWDVLLTVDGGVSIGKPYLFDMAADFTIDSHVTILRPEGISPLALVYLLASPLGQMQFRRAESGASGQTTVTEDDIRRFVFPKGVLKKIDKLAMEIEQDRGRIASERKRLAAEEAKLWEKLNNLYEA